MSTCTIDAKFNLPIIMRQTPKSAVEIDKITNVVAITSLLSSIFSTISPAMADKKIRPE